MKLIKKILEMSPHFNVSKTVSSKYLDQKILGLIQQSEIIQLDTNIFKTNMVNKYGEHVYFIGKQSKNDYDILAGVYGFIETHNNVKVFISSATKKYDSTFASAALKLYSWISKNTEVQYIMSDEIHSKDSKLIWQHWLNNPEKYGISEIYLYDIENKIRLGGDIDQYWCNRPECKNYRVIVKFK